MAIVTPGQYAGTSFAAIDGKGRIAVPSQFRNNVPPNWSSAAAVEEAGQACSGRS